MTLKDKNCQIKAVMWRTAAARLPFQLEDGQAIICQGGVEVYPPRGTYQLVMQRVQPKAWAVFNWLFNNCTSDWLPKVVCPGAQASLAALSTTHRLCDQSQWRGRARLRRSRSSALAAHAVANHTGQGTRYRRGRRHCARHSPGRKAGAKAGSVGRRARWWKPGRLVVLQ